MHGYSTICVEQSIPYNTSIKFGPDDVRVASQHILDSHNIIKGYVNLCYKNFNPESHRPEDCGRQFSFHPDPIEVEKVNITAGQGQRTDTRDEISKSKMTKTRK